MAGSVFSGRLWRHRDFMKLWTAQGISAFGARITREGLPLAAVLTLDATPAQLGLLAALTMGPGLLVGLLVGGFVDRSRRKRILLGADLVRMAVLMTVPAAAWTGLLRIEQLYLVAAAVGAASALFDLADNAFLPSLIDRVDLLEGNSKLGVTDSVAEVGGPALAGVLFLLASPVRSLRTVRGAQDQTTFSPAVAHAGRCGVQISPSWPDLFGPPMNTVFDGGAVTLSGPILHFSAHGWPEQVGP